MEKIAASIRPTTVYKAKETGIAEGVRATAEQLMDPDSPMFLPCGTGVRATATRYRREIVISPADPEVEFSGVVVLRPNIREYLYVNTKNGTGITASSATLQSKEFGDAGRAPFIINNYYHPAFLVKNSSGTVLGSSYLLQIEDLNHWGQDPQSGQWLRGHINVVQANVGASANAFANFITFSPNTSPASNISNTVFVGSIDATGTFTFYASAVLSAEAQSGAFPDLSGTLSEFVSYAIKATTNFGGEETFQVSGSIYSLDLTSFDPVEYFAQPQVESDAVYTALRDNNSGLRMGAASLLAGFRGSTMNDGGLIAVARVPEGTPIPLGDALDCYNFIAALPYDAYTGKVNQGGHVFWQPKTLRDILFKKKADPLDDSNMLVMAFIVPGSSAGQITSLSIVAKSAWEWVYDSQSMPQFLVPPGWQFLEALYAVLAQFNPSGENPKHLAKIKEIARKVAANPVVQAYAKQALALGVASAKKALPALLAGIAL